MTALDYRRNQCAITKKAQESKDWRVTKGTPSSGGDIVIMDGSTWYLADRAAD